MLQRMMSKTGIGMGMVWIVYFVSIQMDKAKT